MGERLYREPQHLLSLVPMRCMGMPGPTALLSGFTRSKADKRQNFSRSFGVGVDAAEIVMEMRRISQGVFPCGAWETEELSRRVVISTAGRDLRCSLHQRFLPLVEDASRVVRGCSQLLGIAALSPTYAVHRYCDKIKVVGEQLYREPQHLLDGVRAEGLIFRQKKSPAEWPGITSSTKRFAAN